VATGSADVDSVEIDAPFVAPRDSTVTRIESGIASVLRWNVHRGVARARFAAPSAPV